MRTLEEVKAEKKAQDEADLAQAVSKGMNPPPVGQRGLYQYGKEVPVPFEIVSVKGMLCYAHYAWQNPQDPPSCFIWGFLRDGEYNALHTWHGHPEWKDTLCMNSS